MQHNETIHEHVNSYREMTRIESENMVHFLHRPTMYVGQVTRENIVSFMHGINMGKRIGPFWTKLLKEHIENKYEIFGSSTGWPYQVEQYSGKKQLSWNEGFKVLMLELIEESEQIPFTKKIQELNQKLHEHNMKLKLKYGS